MAQYYYCPVLSQLFRDKDTGEPLAGGKIYFYKDKDRTTLKPVFKLSGSPGSYSYIQYDTNPDGSVPINGYGKLEYGLYVYPFDANGDEELYYLVVKNSDDVTQYDMQGFPIESQGSSPTTGFREHNYFKNGQFLSHNLLSADTGPPVYAEGQIRAATTQIAPDAWTFERDSSSTATDFIKFTKLSSYSDTPPENARFNFNASCTATNPGDSFKNLCYTFDNVNRFASANGKVTISWWAKLNTGSSLTMNLSALRHYGSGGASDETIPINTSDITVTDSWQQFTYTWTPGETTGNTIGSAGDDYLKIQFKLPAEDTYDIEINNFILQDGEIGTPVYPEQSDHETYNSVGGAFPGTIWDYAGHSDPNGWFSCDGREISRSSFPELFAVSHFTQSGTLNASTTVTALTDTSSMFAGMHVTGTNSPASTTIASVDSATQITLSAAATGSGSTTLTFYLWGAGDGTATFNIPDFRGRVGIGAGTGTYPSASAFVPGMYGGEETHALTGTENGPHTHTYNETGFVAGSTIVSGSGLTESLVSTTSGSSGTGSPHNNMQPYLAVNKIIKY